MSKEDVTNALDEVMNPDLDGVADTEERGEEPTETHVSDDSHKKPDQDFSSVLEDIAAKAGSVDDIAKRLEEAELYKKKFGDSRNEVGELRRELKNAMQELRTLKQSTHRSDSYDDDFVTHEEKPLTLNDLKTFLPDFLSKQREAEQEGQRKYQAWLNDQNEQIISRPSFKYFEKDFKKVIATPSVQRAIEEGRADYVSVYRDLELAKIVDIKTKNSRSGPKSKTDEPNTSERNTNTDTEEELKKRSKKKAIDTGDYKKVIDSLFE